MPSPSWLNEPSLDRDVYEQRLAVDPQSAELVAEAVELLYSSKAVETTLSISTTGPILVSSNYPLDAVSWKGLAALAASIALVAVIGSQFWVRNVRNDRNNMASVVHAWTELQADGSGVALAEADSSVDISESLDEDVPNWLILATAATTFLPNSEVVQ